MEPRPSPRIIEAELLRDGVVITFEDGSGALYSAALLQSVVDQAQALPQENEKRGH